jgi:hypothetical protein
MSTAADSKPIRYLGPVCFTLRWLCLFVAALTVLTCAGIAVAIPLAKDDAGYQMQLGHKDEPVFSRVSPTHDEHNRKNRFLVTVDGRSGPLSGGMLAGALTAALVGVAGLVWGLWNGAGLFKRLGQREYFARRTVAALRNFAIGLLIYKVAPLFALPFLSAAAPARAPGKSLKFSLNFNVMQMDGVLTIIFLGMIIVFAHIMTKAVEIAEDNAQIV